MSKKKAGYNDQLLDIVVNFGNVGVGDKSARLGVTVSRSLLTVAKAEKQFCEKRLSCCLVIAEDGAPPGQGTLGDVNGDVDLEADFDVKSIRFSSDEISFGLTGMLGSLDVGLLAKFAKKQGRLIVKDVTEIPEVDRKGAAAGEKDEDDED
jgi:hypothetical protein